MLIPEISVRGAKDSIKRIALTDHVRVKAEHNGLEASDFPKNLGGSLSGRTGASSAIAV